MDKVEKMSNSLILTLKEGIVYVDFEKKVLLDAEKSRILVQNRLKFQEGKDFPVLLNISLVSFPKDGRDYMKKEGSKGIVAGAFLTNSFFTKTILNFFISVSTPEVPARIFTDKEEAIKWLNQYKQ